jgi:fructoselysine-6-P-deglycase FrlB-like protein
MTTAPRSGSEADGLKLDGSTSLTSAEIATQPWCWRQAGAIAGTPAAAGLPKAGERVAVVGCGTSWFIAMAYAALREGSGLGETDAFAASEFPHGRSYDRIVALTRSGTTTEVLELLAKVKGATPTTAVTGDPETPIMQAADEVVVLDFADEKSVVQTRFATTALALFRAHLATQGTVLDASGREVPTVEQAATDAELALAGPIPAAALDAEQFTYLGAGWTCGLAQEAGLKMREASGSWTEAYPAMEYRHGPISITGPNRVAWAFGSVPTGLPAQVDGVGGTLISESDPAETGALDPMADLIRVQRLAVVLAERKGYDPDSPRNLTRSVVLG